MSRASESIRRAVACCVAIATAALLVAAPAQAEFGIHSFAAGATKADGTAEMQAAAHPYAYTAGFQLNTTEQDGLIFADDNVRDLIVDSPPGLIGNPQVVPTCPRILLNESACSPASQIGMIKLKTDPLGTPDLELIGGELPVYNMQTRDGDVADFGFVVTGVPIHLVSSLDAANGYAVRTAVEYVSEAEPLVLSELTLWGVPADPRHDVERGSAIGLTPRPFLTNPSFCGPPLASKLAVDSWQNPGAWKEATSTTLTGSTGCDSLTFDASLAVDTDNAQADSPTGLGVDVSIPQSEGVNTLATPTLRKAVVKLPAGLAVNPSSATGLGSCSEAQVGLGGDGVANCPAASKIGTVKVDTPVLPNSLEGSVYLATPNQNPFGSLLALYLVVSDPKTGVVVKLPGRVDADPATGQLTSSFEETPQLPFSNLHLQLKSGPRAPLRTPATCGSFRVASALTPWSAPGSGPASTPSAGFVVSQGANGSACPAGALPGSAELSAGTVSPVAGAYSPFVLRVSRPDGSQEIKAIDAKLPPGLLGRLKGTAYCPEAAIAAAAGKTGAAEQASPSCPASSRVGSVTVAAGAGSNPFQAEGAAYLTGPYKGAPLGLAIVTPALAGPFDLGTVVVRSTLRVDPSSAQIAVKSDPIPGILQGIPLDIRTVEVRVDRPDFTLNPTSCDRMSVSADVFGVSSLSSLANPFQVANCASLGFAPKLSLSLKGATRRGSYPKLRAVLTAKPGQANVNRVSVSLPHSEFLAQEHIKTICTRVQFAADQCPKGSIYGYAKATTPLLDQPLSGPVYLRSSSNPLPDLVAALHGQIDIDLTGRIDSVKGGIRTSFETVPDAPVSKFVLAMKGGKKSLLVNSRNLCAATNKAKALIDGQNGKTADQSPVLTNSCGPAKFRGSFSSK